MIDATCGNGYDTLTLLKMVADELGRGCVYAMDIQKDALINTNSLLEESVNAKEVPQFCTFSYLLLWILQEKQKITTFVIQEMSPNDFAQLSKTIFAIIHFQFWHIAVFELNCHDCLIFCFLFYKLLWLSNLKSLKYIAENFLVLITWSLA